MRAVARIFVPFACAYFLSYFYRAVNAVLSPDLVRDLRLDASDLGLLTSAYLLAFGLFQLPLGLLLDRLAPRRVNAALLGVAACGAALAILCVVPERGGAQPRESGRALVAGFRSIYCDPGFWRIAGVSMTVPSASLAYAIQTRRYDASLAGRVATAVNLLGFLGAFAAQWGVGVVVDLWPAEAGRPPATAYGAGFGALALAEALALAVLALTKEPTADR